MATGGSRSADGARGSSGFSSRVRLLLVPTGLACVLLIASVLRIWHLEANSLWFDEAFSLFVAQKPLATIPTFVRLSDTHPPLYYLVLHVWAGLVGRDEFALRALSALFSVVAVLLTFLLGRRLTGDGVGLLAAALVAVSPFQVVAAQEARMYPLLMLAGVGASYALLLAVEDGRRRHWLAYIALTTLAIYTHHFGFLLILAHAVFVVALPKDRAAGRKWAMALGVIVLLYLPLVPTLYAHVVSSRAWPDFRAPFGLGALTDMLGLFSFGGKLFGMGTYFARGPLALENRLPLLLPFMLLAAYGAANLSGRRRRVFVLAYWLTPIFAASLISLRLNIFYERYFSFLTPAFAILTASGIAGVAHAAGGRGRIAALVSLMAIVLSYNLPVLANVYKGTDTYDWRGAARYVTANARPTDFILYVPASARLPFEYYFRGPQRRASVPLAALAQSLGGQPAWTKGFRGIAHSYPRLWVVATVPLTREERQEMGRYLEAYFQEADGRDFGLTYIFLWISRSAGSRVPGEVALN